MIGGVVSHRRVLEKIALASAFWILTASPLLGGVIPGRWDKVASLPQDTQILITLRSSDEIEGRYQNLNEGTLLFRDLSGVEVSIPQSAVEKIASAEPVPDPVWNGTLIGLGIGTGTGALLGTALYRKEGEPVIFSRGDTAAIFAVAGAAVGATLGLVADALNKSAEVFYLAVDSSSIE